MNKIFLGCFYSYSGNKNETRKQPVMQTDTNGRHSLLQLTSNHRQFQNGKATSNHNNGTMTPPPHLTLQQQAVVQHPPSSDPNLDRLKEDTPKLIHQIITDKTTNAYNVKYRPDLNNASSQQWHGGNGQDVSDRNRLTTNNLTDKATQTSKNADNSPTSNNNNNNSPPPTELETTVNKKRLVSSASVDNGNMNFVFDSAERTAFHNPGFTDDSINESNPFQIPSPELQVMMNTHTNVIVKRKNSLKLSKSDTSGLKQDKKGCHESQRKLVTRALQSFAASNRANNNINNSLKQNNRKTNCPDNSLIISNIPAINKQKDLLVLDSPQSNEKPAPKIPVQNGLKGTSKTLDEQTTAKDKISTGQGKIPIPEKLKENCFQASSDSLDMTAPVSENLQQTSQIKSFTQSDGKHQNTPKEKYGASRNSFKVSLLNTHVRNLSLDSPIHVGIHNGMQQLCIEKSILDWMHKKYCSEQYKKKRSSSADTVNCINGQYFVQLLEKPPNDSDQNGEDVASFSLHTLQYYKLPKSTVHAGNYQTAPPSFRREFKYKQQRIITNGTLDKGLEKRKRERLQAEIEAKEACRWLRYTGFPQYAQMFEDGQFPIDTESVKNDHDFLDDDSFQALCRRLHILNKCCKVQIETPRKTGDDSDEDEQCALSDKWKYQRSSRRWSRMGLQVDQPCGSNRPLTVKGSSSHDSLLTDQDNYSQLEDSPTFSTNDTALTESLGQSETNSKSSVPESHTPIMPTAGHSFLSPKLSRATSFRPARNLLRRIETLRSGGSLRNKKPMDCLMISGPVITDTDNMREKIRHLNCVDLNNGQTNSHSLVSRSRSAENAIRANSPVSLDNSTSSVHEDNSESYLLPSSTESVSDYRAIPTNKVKNNSTSNLTEVYLLPPDYKPGQFPKVINNGYIETGEGHGINYRTGSFSLGRDAKRRDAESRQCANLRAENSVKRASIYDNVPTEESLEADRNELDEILQKLYDNINGFTQAVSTDDFADLEKEISVLRDLRTFDSMMGLDLGTDTFDSQQKQELDLELDLDFEAASEASTHDISAEVLSDSDAETDAGKFFEPGISRERRDSGVGSSLTRAPSLKKRNRIRWTSFQKSHRPSFRSHSTQICTLSVGQFRKLQSVCMLTITTLLEKYSPASRSGWNWLVPRFIKKTKVPDYKDKKVFGVPLMETLRRTGQPLPQCILYAMRYLRKTAKDADGIFRKSGVKSRIQKLREQIEANSDLVDFSDMQAYDIADLTKQYFRELPECLLTNKLSETFIDIFTHVPKEYQLEAVNTAIILMPDENREVLQSLLLFLSDISDSADQHQMTASNLAVCFAPSLFNLVNVKSTASPSLRRNKKQQGVPDSKEILEPAHECLVFMIKNSKALFTVPQETIAKCRFTSSDLNSPRHIKDFDMNNGNPYLFVDSNTNVLLKESRERFRNWVMCSPINGIDVAFKKAEDFHLLRQWMCNAEIEAPPEEVLNRLLTERYLWDEDLQECSVIEKLSEQTDILEYTRNSMPPHPARDYCLLRSWRTDLPKGACALFSTSVKHSAAKISNVEGIVMESNYLIEPCGAGKSRVTHMSREDMGGRSVRWYNLAYGHINANFMDRLRTSFQQIASGPETKL